MLTEVTTFKKL